MEKMTEGIVKEVGERLELLALNCRFSGEGGLYLRQCNQDDLPELLALGSRTSEWKAYLSEGQVWSMLHLNRIVGTVAWRPQDKDTALIGMLFIKPEWRSSSVAERLLAQIKQETVAFPKHSHDATVEKL